MPIRPRGDAGPVLEGADEGIDLLESEKIGNFSLGDGRALQVMLRQPTARRIQDIAEAGRFLAQLALHGALADGKLPCHMLDAWS